MDNPVSSGLIRPHENSSRVFLTTASGRTWSYGDFVAMTGRIANALRRRGIGAGDRILVQVEKSPEVLALYGACLRLGAVMAPLSTTRSAVDMADFAEEIAPRLVVHDKSVAGLWTSFAASATFNADGTGVLLDEAAGEAPTFDDVPRAPNDVALILYTSGTTGRSKGCLLSQQNLLSNARAIADAWQITSSDVLLHVMPLYHIHGLVISFNALLVAGASMHFLKSFVAPDIISRMPEATILMGTPEQYASLLAHDIFGRDVASRMRLFVSGGALMNGKTIAQFEERCGHRILERHGQTELGVSASNPYAGVRKCGAIGLPLAGISIRVTDRATGDVLQPGREGVLEVKGPNVFLGYLNRPKANAEAFREDGWFITGDVGRFDSDGYVEMLGREDDIIVSKGRRIVVREIEEVIDAAPGIQESAVIGVRQAGQGEGIEGIVGFVVARQDETPSERDVLAYASSRLAADCRPVSIIFTDRLPRNSTGKLERNLLRETYRTLQSGSAADA